MCMASGGGGKDYSKAKGIKIGFSGQSGDNRPIAESRSGASLVGAQTTPPIDFTGQSGESRLRVQSRSGGTLLSGTTRSSIIFTSQSGDGTSLRPKAKTVLGT